MPGTASPHSLCCCMWHRTGHRGLKEERKQADPEVLSRSAGRRAIATCGDAGNSHRSRAGPAAGRVWLRGSGERGAPATPQKATWEGQCQRPASTFSAPGPGKNAGAPPGSITLVLPELVQRGWEACSLVRLQVSPG